MNMIKLLAALAWVAVAVVSATPANAVALTLQSGSYASCGSSYTAYEDVFCYVDETVGYQYQTHYTQFIKFTSRHCNQGGCNPEFSDVYVESVYSTGRKTAQRLGSCELDVYSLGSCAC